MHRIPAVLLVLSLAVTFGCGGKQKEEEKDLRLQEETERTEWREIERLPVDPVDGQVVDDLELLYEYNGEKFYFNNHRNMEEFMKDPEPYLRALKKR